jgi:hypothetical protein
MKWVLLVLGGLIVIGAVVSQQKKEDEEKAVAQGASSAIEVSASQLEVDYRTNEVSADAKYRGKVLRVTGTVDAIKKGISDDPYVTLKTGEMFNDVHANFEDEGTLGTLHPGQRISVRCIGDNVIMGSPMLKRCVLE